MWLSHRHMTEPERCVAAERQDKMKERWEQRTDSGKGDWWGGWEQMEVERKKAWLAGGGRSSPALYRGRVLLLSIFSTGTTDCKECSGALCSDRQELLPSVSAPGARHDPGLTPAQGRGDGTVSSERTFTKHMSGADDILLEQQMPSKQRWEDTSTEKLLHVDTSMKWVSSPQLALPNGALVFTTVRQSLHFSFPRAFEKGKASPHHHLPMSANMKKKKNLLSLWTGLTFSPNVKAAQAIFASPFSPSPNLHHLQDCSGDCQWWLMKGWAVQTPRSSEGATRLTHLEVHLLNAAL